MNAIQWCLFNKVMAGTKEPKKIRHEDCASNERYSVELEFNHKEQNFKLIRGWNSSADDYFILQEVLEAGDLGPRITPPERLLRKILPEELKDWFFYNAEKSVEDLNLDGSAAFKTAMRQIQGFTLIDQLIDDLSKVKKRKQSEIERQGKNKAVSDLRIQVDKLDAEAAPLKSEKQDLSDEIRRLKEGKQKLYAQLLDIPKSKPYEVEREQLKPQLDRFKASLRKKEEEKILFLGRYLPAILLKSSVNSRTDKIAQEKEKEIIVQFPHGNELFAKIEKAGVCICGRPVTKGSIEESNLNALKADAIKPSFNNRIAGLNLTITEINSMVEGFEYELSERDKVIKEDNDSISKLEARLEEIALAIAKLGDSDNKIKEIEDLLSVIDKQLDASQKTWGSKDERLRVINTQIEKLEREIIEASNNETKSQGVEALLEKINKIKTYAEKKLEHDEKVSLNLILVELNNLLEKHAYSNSRALINPETYEVKLRESGDKTRDKLMSSGEDELLKYFFIATILGLANKQTQAKLKYLANPTSCPLIMDAPFTKMGGDFIKGAVGTITDKLEQVILLGLPDDYLKYEDLIKNKLGKKYLVVKADKDSRSESKTKPSKHKILGQDYDLVVYDNKVQGKSVSQTIIEAI
jgi:DNA sulfur modification protein DndD